MIFVTVGHQTPFDRLIEAMDGWAGRTGGECFAQIGDGGYLPRHMPFARFLSPAEFQDRMRRCTAIVAHAGTGTILSAMQLGKPLLVLPRHSARQETRNDHQIATARHFAEAGHLLAAADEHELVERMPELLRQPARQRLGGEAEPGLIETLRTFVAAARR